MGVGEGGTIIWNLRVILELQNCMSDTSAKVSVLFDSSAFGTC